jgi:hypothetical protein
VVALNFIQDGLIYGFFIFLIGCFAFALLDFAFCERRLVKNICICVGLIFTPVGTLLILAAYFFILFNFAILTINDF